MLLTSEMLDILLLLIALAVCGALAISLLLAMFEAGRRS